MVEAETCVLALRERVLHDFADDGWRAGEVQRVVEESGEVSVLLDGERQPQARLSLAHARL